MHITWYHLSLRNTNRSLRTFCSCPIEKLPYFIFWFISCLWKTEYDENDSHHSEPCVAPEGPVGSHQPLNVDETLGKPKVPQPGEGNCEGIQFSSHLKVEIILLLTYKMFSPLLRESQIWDNYFYKTDQNIWLSLNSCFALLYCRVKYLCRQNLSHHRPGHSTEPYHEAEDHEDDADQGHPGPAREGRGLSAVVVEAEDDEAEAGAEAGCD